MDEKVRRDEWVVERDLGGYRLPDHAIDLSAWLRDGLEVYNLFVVMKPMFFAMLKAHGGEFTASYEQMNEDHGSRISFEEGKLTFDADNKAHQTVTVRLGESTGKTQRFKDDKSLLAEEGRE